VPKPKLTKSVRTGLWLIVARSATVMDAESPDGGMDKKDMEMVLAAAKYAEAHWKPKGEANE